MYALDHVGEHVGDGQHREFVQVLVGVERNGVRAAITHPVLSGPAYERINDSALQEVIVTDTIPLNPDKDLHKFTVLSVADMFADVIERVHNYKEISSIFFK